VKEWGRERERVRRSKGRSRGKGGEMTSTLYEYKKN
jgi:hypothetical protein